MKIYGEAVCGTASKATYGAEQFAGWLAEQSIAVCGTASRAAGGAERLVEQSSLPDAESSSWGGWQSGAPWRGGAISFGTRREAALTECCSGPWEDHNCNHREDVGVVCSGPAMSLGVWLLPSALVLLLLVSAPIITCILKKGAPTLPEPLRTGNGSKGQPEEDPAMEEESAIYARVTASAATASCLLPPKSCQDPRRAVCSQKDGTAFVGAWACWCTSQTPSPLPSCSPTPLTTTSTVLSLASRSAQAKSTLVTWRKSMQGCTIICLPTAAQRSRKPSWANARKRLWSPQGISVSRPPCPMLPKQSLKCL
ncbi:uncharacterized protein [Lepidochelys kempii]|uniref:uncharacterized protein isoform X1 n=1 Tax=Lepidochelys kempii TaxID=8472 RepID=UPI003C6F6F3E